MSKKRGDDEHEERKKETGGRETHGPIYPSVKHHVYCEEAVGFLFSVIH
jgi:hypothetical protein